MPCIFYITWVLTGRFSLLSLALPRRRRRVITKFKLLAADNDLTVAVTNIPDSGAVFGRMKANGDLVPGLECVSGPPGPA